MIQETRTYRCRRCGSGDIVQNGRNRYGNPQYPCKACGAYGVLEPKVRYTEAQKEQILRAYPERVRLRGRPRRYGVSIGTVLPPVAETLRPAEEGDVLEVLWGGRTGRSRQVVACVGSHRSEALGNHPGSLSGLQGGLRPTHRSGDKPSGQRAHIERGHNTVRQRLARYVRKTLFFSRSLAFHEAVTRWFVTDSNLGLLSSVTIKAWARHSA
jgi:transposase-like protein